MDLEFTGKRALVTGAGQGIGKALCLKLCSMGVEVVALDNNSRQLIDLAKEVPPNQKVNSVTFDLNQKGIGSEAFEEHLSQYAPFHFLVNNAGVYIKEDFFDIKPATFDQTFNVNLRSHIFLTQYITRTMVSNGIKGSVVNISSQASKNPYPMQCCYSVSKAAIDSLTRNVAWELGPNGIRVNAINPTLVNNTRIKALFCPDESILKKLQGKVPLNRFADIENVLDAVVFLLSNRSQFISGHCLSMDGGPYV